MKKKIIKLLVKEPKLLYAVVWEDAAGQTIHLFKTIVQAKEFQEALQ